MTKFNQCPNCGKKPSGGLFGGSYFDIYECRECKKKGHTTCYCYYCGGSRCPNCGSQDRTKVGECWKKD